uniref:Uncharacterized protein n=1 Tax=Oryza nivara TaxID=4536 RepID=A0A0E0J3Q5_ORYNI
MKDKDFEEELMELFSVRQLHLHPSSITSWPINQKRLTDMDIDKMICEVRKQSGTTNCPRKSRLGYQAECAECWHPCKHVQVPCFYGYHVKSQLG